MKKRKRRSTGNREEAVLWQGRNKNSKVSGGMKLIRAARQLAAKNVGG
jgi:hypothetical protein